MKKLTMKDIAAALNTDASTVSRALSNTPGVGKTKRDEIMKYVEEVGYVPDIHAQLLRKGK